MELVFGLFTSLGAAAVPEVVAAGAAYGGWTTTVTAGAGAASTALSVLQGVATAGSVLAGLAGGLSSYSEAQTMRALSDVEAGQERLASEEKALRIKRDALEKIGAARVAFAGSGVRLGSGSADAVEGEIENRAEFELGIERQNAVQRELAARLRGKAYETRGTMSLVSGGAKALTAAGNYGIDLARRG